MKTDSLFYRIFKTNPETFFLVLGMSSDAAREMAARYEFQAIEFKETSHRTDGVFLPAEPGLPVYFVEVQFYPLASVFADLAAKVYFIYKLPRLRRKEIQAMLQVNDIRETRVYQEAIEEGVEKGTKEGIKEGISRAIVKMAASEMPTEKIAAILEVDIELVRDALSGRTNGST